MVALKPFLSNFPKGLKSTPHEVIPYYLKTSTTEVDSNQGPTTKAFTITQKRKTQYTIDTVNFIIDIFSSNDDLTYSATMKIQVNDRIVSEVIFSLLHSGDPEAGGTSHQVLLPKSTFWRTNDTINLIVEIKGLDAFATGTFSCELVGNSQLI